MALSPACAADAVDVILVFIGDIVVKHRVHIVHVDAPGGHIRCNEYAELPLPEQGHHRLPLALGDVPVDALGIQATHLQELGQPLRGALGVAEAHDPLQLFPGDNAGDGVHLLVGGHLYAILQDIRLILLGSLNSNLLRIPLVDPGDVHNFPGNSSGEHAQILAVRDLVQDPRHVVDEAHVQHAVCLVQHHGLYLLHRDGTALHVVGQAARGGHHDLGLPFEGIDLLADGLAAI